MDCARKMKLSLSPMFAALVAAVAVALPAQAQVKGDIAAGEGKVAMCIGCHGISGYKASFPEVYRVPKIAGQSAKYIGTVLEEYRKGTRKHPSMRGIAGSMTDQDIADVAAYYEALGKIEGAPELPAPREPGAQVKEFQVMVLAALGEKAQGSVGASIPKPRIRGDVRHLLDRARRYQALLDSGACRSLAAIAEREDITPTRVGQVLLLLHLHPEILALLDQPSGRAPVVRYHDLLRVARMRDQRRQLKAFYELIASSGGAAEAK